MIDQIEILESEYDQIFDSLKKRTVVYAGESADIYEDGVLVLQEEHGQYFKIKRNTVLQADYSELERAMLDSKTGYNPLINTGRTKC